MVSSTVVDNLRMCGIAFFTLATVGFAFATTVFRVQRKRIQCILALPSMIALLIYYVFAKNDATTVLRIGDGKFAEVGFWLALIIYAVFDTFSVSIMTALSKVQGIAAAIALFGATWLFYLSARCDIHDTRWAAYSLAIILVAYWIWHQWFHSRAIRRINVDVDGKEQSDPLSISSLEMLIIIVAILWTALTIVVAAIGLGAGPAGDNKISQTEAEIPYFTATLMVLVGAMGKVALDRDHTTSA